MFTRRKKAFILILALITIPVIGFFCFENRWIQQPLRIGEQIPPVKVNTLEGNKASVCSANSKKSLIIFFSVDCAHCLKEMKEISVFYPVIKDSLNVAAISISDLTATRDFVKSQKIPFSVYVDSDSEARDSFRVFPIPALFFIDKDWRLLQYKAGEQKRAYLWTMLKKMAGFVEDTSNKANL
ncbi:MAG: TlpA family protein disulfide reductase [Bacteroidetes bacterium]|nr:TlpA family protein disulfide reductase [Bacteroidota bacterium]